MNHEKENTQHITALLHEWKSGKKDAFDQLFPFVYEELRRRASSYLRNELRDTLFKRRLWSMKHT